MEKRMPEKEMRSTAALRRVTLNARVVSVNDLHRTKKKTARR